MSAKPSPSVEGLGGVAYASSLYHPLFKSFSTVRHRRFTGGFSASRIFTRDKLLSLTHGAKRLSRPSCRFFSFSRGEYATFSSQTRRSSVSCHSAYSFISVGV